jgi:hypothetical protein
MRWIEADPAVSTRCAKRVLSVKANGEDYIDLVVLTYPSNRTLVLAAGTTYSTCDSMVDADETGYHLTGRTALWIYGFEPPDPPFPKRSVPARNLVGASLLRRTPRGERVMRRGVFVDGEIPGSGPPWRIVFTSPPPGGMATGSLDVLVSVPRVAPCRADQLAATLLPGAAGTGMVFAELAIVDTSATACRLKGPVTISALNRAGDQYARAKSSAHGTGRFPLVLQPRSGRGQRNHGLEAQTTLEDPVFPGSCPDGRSHPSGWSLALPDGGTIDVADPNRHSRDSVEVCDGSIAPGTITLTQ